MDRVREIIKGQGGELIKGQDDGSDEGRLRENIKGKDEGNDKGI